MLHIENHNDTKRIVLQNSYKKKDIVELIEILNINKKVDISFVNIDVIESSLIKKIIEYKQNLTIETNNKNLWIYLINLGIKVKLNSKIKENNIKHTTTRAIAIGGSAGSLANIIKIVKNLPYLDISVFIVIHILPNEKSKLVEILNPLTSYTVKEANNGEKIETKHIYIAKPNLHMVVEDGYIFHSNSAKINYCRPSIDILFQTLATEYKSSLLSIITCGYLDDGSRALDDMKINGGISIIQEPDECEAKDMPNNAILRQKHDFVLKVEDISKYLSDKLNATLLMDDRIKTFIKHIDDVYGYDFTHYDIKSLSRRINLLKDELGIEHFTEFEYKVLHDSDIFELLFRKLSINVSEFFRDPLMYKEFINSIVPILNTYPYIRIWSSASSKGQEAYSIAMLLDKIGILNKSIIYATDFNSTVVNQSKNGFYTNKEFDITKNNYSKIGDEKELENWFNIYDDFVEVKDKIKDKVQFFQHNLVTDGEINEFHIVFCRNVLIYFDEELQDKVIDLINSSLVWGGFLILGNSEHLNRKDKFLKINKDPNNRIFKKVKG